MFMSKQYQKEDQKLSTTGSYFAGRGKKSHKGILEHYGTILLSPMRFILKKSPGFNIHFDQTLAVTDYSVTY
jgi:hypothetical protein